MYYKSDWKKAKQRLQAFWAGEYTGRACMGILCPRRTSSLPRFPHLTHGPWLGGLEKLKDEDQEAVIRWWTDPEENYSRMKRWFENTCFGGEAVPATYINWGASAGCAFWGAAPIFSTKTVWFPKVIEDWETWEWRFDMDQNQYWQNILSILRIFIERNNEDYFTGIPEIGNAADNLSLIRGATDLAIDTIFNPAPLQKAVDIMSGAWVDAHEVIFNMLKNCNDGGSCLPWLNLWAPGKTDQLANDFSSMLSTETFREFFFPELKKMGQYLEYPVFHLDGPQCIQMHTDALLELEEIRCIQFSPGAGSPPTTTAEYIPFYKKIQGAGKNLYLLADPCEVETLLDNLSAKGLFINTWAESEDEMEQLIRLAEKKSVVR